MIRFACPGCSSTFSVDDAKAGKSGKCPKCGAAFIIPQAEAPAEAPPPLPVPPPPVPVPQGPAVDPNAPVEIDPCPKCQTKLSVAASDLGNDVECPYCKTVFASARAGTRPPAPPPAPGKKSGSDLDFTGKPKPRRDREDVEDEDRPRRRKRDDEEDERPSKRRSARRDEDDEEDERPSRRGKPPVSRRDDDEDEDERPSRRRSRSRRDDDEDDDYDDRPSRRRSRSRRRSGGSGERSGAVTAASVMTIVVGALWLIGAGLIFFGSAFLFNAIGGLPRGGFNQQGRDAAEGALVGMTLCCGVPTLLMAILHILGGVFALQRKTAGRIIVIICASLALLFGLFALYAMFRLFFVLPVFPPIEILLYQLLNLLMTLGYGTFAMIVMCRSDYADEFD